ncbi:MAG: hypothetical protein ACOY3P_16405 [Planctomycetota bacterium]
MSYYKHKMRILLTRRTGDWLKLQERPRLSAAVVLLIACLVAVLCWRGVAVAGVRSEGLRLAVSCVAAYAAYLAGVATWFARFSPVELKSLLAGGTGGAIATQVPGESEFDDALDTSMDTAFREAGNQARNVLGMLLAVAVLGSLFVSIHFIFHAPYYLGQLLVDGGKIRHRAMSTGNDLDAIVLPFLQSWPIALVLLLHYMMIGFVVDAALK